MKLYGFLISIFIVLIFNCSNEYTCNDFHEGEFIYFNFDENKFDYKVKAIRTKTKQIVIAPEKGDTLSYELNWKSNCQYELTLIESNKKPKRHLVQIGGKLIVDIEAIDKTSFYYKSKMLDHEFGREFKGKMKKIK